jgi:hypothetical protein
MLKHLTTDNHICRFVAVSLCVVICNETNISREIVARPGPITRPDADPAVVPTITDNFQELPATTSDFDDAFPVQIVLRDKNVC